MPTQKQLRLTPFPNGGWTIAACSQAECHDQWLGAYTTPDSMLAALRRHLEQATGQHIERPGPVAGPNLELLAPGLATVAIPVDLVSQLVEVLQDEAAGYLRKGHPRASLCSRLSAQLKAYLVEPMP